MVPLCTSQKSKNCQKPEKKTKQSSGGNKILGGPRGGRVHKDIEAVLGKGGKSKRLASKDPTQLMKNLNASKPSGKNDEDKIENYLSQVIGATDEMSAAFSGIEKKKDSYGRIGWHIKSTFKTHHALFFIFDAVRGAINAGLFDLDEKVRIGAASGGSVVYHVKSESEKWNEKA